MNELRRPCADCTLPVALAYDEGILRPVDGRFDGEDIVHDDCYNARCPGNGLPLGCGERLGVACGHRDCAGNAWDIGAAA